MIIDEEEEEEKVETVKIEEIPDDELQNNNKLLNHLGDKEIIQLKSNYFPKGLVPLEELFDQNDVAKAHGVIPTGTKVEDFNIGTEEDPKLIKISKTLPQKEQAQST